MAWLSKRKMRYFALIDFILACLAILLQLAVLITLHQWVDWICIGFWGGVLMFFAGGAALQKRKQVIFFTILSIMSGLTMIGFYSWAVSEIDCHDFPLRNNSWNDDDLFDDLYDEDLCDWRFASDILFIILGLLVLVVNMGLAMSASSSDEHDTRAHHAPSAAFGAAVGPAGYPSTIPPGTTYIITNPPANYGNQPVTYPPPQTAPYGAYPPPNPSYPVEGTSTVAYNQPPPYNPDIHSKNFH